MRRTTYKCKNNARQLKSTCRRPPFARLIARLIQPRAANAPTIDPLSSGQGRRQSAKFNLQSTQTPFRTQPGTIDPWRYPNTSPTKRISPISRYFDSTRKKMGTEPSHFLSRDVSIPSRLAGSFLISPSISDSRPRSRAVAPSPQKHLASQLNRVPLYRLRRTVNRPRAKYLQSSFGKLLACNTNQGAPSNITGGLRRRVFRKADTTNSQSLVQLEGITIAAISRHSTRPLRNLD